MYEKILQKLKTQRGQNLQVSDKTLEAKAKSLEVLITDDDILAKADFTSEIESMQGNIGHVAKQVKEDTEKTLKKVDKTPAEIEAERLAKETKEKEDKEKGISPEVSSLIEQNKKILETLASMQGEKITTSRADILNQKLKDTPLIFKDATLNGFNRMKFNSDEEFSEYISEIEILAKNAIQVGKESNLNTSTPDITVKKPEDTKLNPVFGKAVEAFDNQESKKKE